MTTKYFDHISNKIAAAKQSAEGFSKGIASGPSSKTDVLVARPWQADSLKVSHTMPATIWPRVLIYKRNHIGDPANWELRSAESFSALQQTWARKGRFMLSNSDGRSVDRVLAHHKRRRHCGLTPLNPDAEIQVIAQFREVFRNARAKRR